MKYMNIAWGAFFVFSLSACSHSGSDVVEDLAVMQLPVVQMASHTEKDDLPTLHTTYLENAGDIHGIIVFLKQRYLEGTSNKEMFDTHSQAHQVYICLTNLEQAGLLNRHYYDQHNAEGLLALHNQLKPVVMKMQAQIGLTPQA